MNEKLLKAESVFSGIDLRGPPHQFVVGPLVFVHPAEENVEKVDEELLIEGKDLSMLVQFSDYFVADVDYVDGFVGLPVVLLVLPLHEKPNVVYKTVQHSFLGL